MARKKPDKLSMCAAMAKEAGVSYGKYMAMKEPEIEAPAKTGTRRICKHCGKEFFVNHRMRKDYCDDRCRERYYYQNYKLVEPTLRICPICGTEFMAKNQNRKYCSKHCTDVAHAQKVKANNAFYSRKENDYGK